MKTVGMVMLALAGMSGAAAAEQRVSARQLAEAPKDYVGRTIVVSGIGCVDDPKGGFVCIATVGGRAVRIEASVLGAKTRQEIAERLIGACKGLGSLSRPACRVDAEIEPRNVITETIETPGGRMPGVLIATAEIDLYAPKRR